MNFLFISSLSCLVFAQQPVVQPNKLAVRKPASDSNLSQRLALAKEFIEMGGMKKEFELAILGGDAVIDRQLAGKNPNSSPEQKKAAAIAKPKWDAKKSALFETASSNLQKEMANYFSETELKYLVELAKSTVYKKYHGFLETDAYTKFYSYPGETARALLAEAKKEVATPTPPTTK